MASEEGLAFATSLLVAAKAVAWSFPAAGAGGLLVSRGRFPGRTLVEAALQAPLVISPVAAGLLLLVLFGAEGPIGRPLRILFGVRLVFTQAGAALAAGVGALPVMAGAVRAALDAVDPRFERAAASLGAGPFDRLLTVTLPLAASGLVSAAVLGFATCLGEFGAVITFAGDVRGVTETLPLAIWGRLQAPGGEGGALRLAGLSFALSVVALLVAGRLGPRSLVRRLSP